jgi:hypothetical protein
MRLFRQTLQALFKGLVNCALLSPINEALSGSRFLSIQKIRRFYIVTQPRLRRLTWRLRIAYADMRRRSGVDRSKLPIAV